MKLQDIFEILSNSNQMALQLDWIVSKGSNMVIFNSHMFECTGIVSGTLDPCEGICSQFH